jgi:hypothetical protein
MACDANDEKAGQCGPYKTAEEAEHQARTLGWGWVLVYTHVLDKNGTITDVTKRFYQPTTYPLRTPGQVEALRHNLSTPDPPPLNHEEILFFAAYEVQMLPEPAPRINAAKFKAEIKRRING